MTELIDTLRFITTHPLTRHARIAALARFASWQVRSRLREELVVPWVYPTKLAVRRGMTGATGNIYCGLHEFADMGFLLHFLRPNDLFIDIGANIGSYTVLASGVVGARSWAVEPDPSTVERLARNVEVNGIDDKVVVYPFALGDREGDVPFTIGLDTVNRVAAAGEPGTRMVRQRTLDALTEGVEPTMIKMDVEGYEEIVLKGAKEPWQEPRFKPSRPKQSQRISRPRWGLLASYGRSTIRLQGSFPTDLAALEAPTPFSLETGRL